MPVTIKVNGPNLSLVHKFSNGISTATIPDVCKTPTPGGPVPMPYPNIAQSITLSNGTTTVKGDKIMAANKGSKFALSNGDQPGTIGGVKSNVFMKEATWILYSFDVKMNGKNACRLTDPMFHNSENAANLAGIFQPPVALAVTDKEREVGEELCKAFCKKLKEGFERKKLKDGSLSRRWTRKTNVQSRNWSNELERDLAAEGTPWRGLSRVEFPCGSFGSGRTIPDALLRAPDNSLQRCFDFKFPGDRFRGNQRMRLANLSGGRRPIPISTKTCAC